ncbi:hypothetical protein GCM10022233_39190 [Streptomyces shaanxiensis]|uniref:Integrase n=1 Tax=Streptomyces shaanxiensis TaxID=653357 RepID=A0ABP7V891_9ACTN
MSPPGVVSGRNGAERPWRIRPARGVLEVTGRTRNDAEKRLTAVHRAIRIREKWMGPFPPRAVARLVSRARRHTSHDTPPQACAHPRDTTASVPPVQRGE